MAYLPYDQTQEEQDKEKGAAKEGGAGPVLGAPNATPIQGSGSGQAAGTTQGANKPSRSGSFTNLMSYVNANKGNDTAMAGSIKNNVQNKAQEADQAGSQFLDTAKTAVDKGTVKQDEKVQTEVKQLGSTPANRTAGAPAPAPVQVDQEAFNSQYNADYVGPNDARDVDGFADTQNAFNQVAIYGQTAAGDMSDRGVLLDDVYGKDGKQYTSGERKLDSFILGAGSDGQAAMQEIANTYGGYGQNFRNIMDTIGYREGPDGEGPSGLVGEGIATSDATRQAMRDIVGNTQSELSSYFDPLATEAQSKTDAALKEQKLLAKGDPKALARAGFSPEQIAIIRANPSLLSQIASVGSGWGLGDLSDDTTEGNYGHLIDLLTGAGAEDATSKYDFTNKGGKGLEVSEKIRTGTRDIAALDSSFDKKTKTANAERDAEFERANAQLGALNTPGSIADLTKYGITQQQLDLARIYGIDLRQFLKQGGDLSMGQVLTDKDRSVYSNILQMLGLDPNLASHFMPQGDAGAAFTYDVAGLEQAIGAAIAANPPSGPAWAEGTILGSPVPEPEAAPAPRAEEDDDWVYDSILNPGSV